MARLLIVNLNLDPEELGGCQQLQRSFKALAEHSSQIAPWAELRSGGHLGPWDGVVLGPQGTPFSAYDVDFLPWLQRFVDALTCPVLAVCGGMQALALASGGRLHATFGGEIGPTYQGHQKLRGPLAVGLDRRALPTWLPAGLADQWQEAGGQVFESHVEQVQTLPGPWQVVASSTLTPIEGYVHPQRPILASQFHPELHWDGECAAGRVWLQAWLAVVHGLQRDGTNLG